MTTALLGNCGVTFAPCKPADRALLAAMMETVEDIPREAILGGLSWEWESYGEYLDALDKLNPAINVAGMVGHSALRWYVSQVALDPAGAIGRTILLVLALAIFVGWPLWFVVRG